MRSSGVLLTGGLLFNLIVTMAWHPSGSEDDHPEIFTAYATDGGWVLTHFGQFVGVEIGLAGLIVLCVALLRTSRARVLAWLGIGATTATATMFAVLQAIDGIALKQAVGAWYVTSGSQKEFRFADAEVVRWLEWGLQSYFRMLLGVTLVLVGSALARAGFRPFWLAWLAAISGVLSLAVGVDVGYNGLEGAFQDLAAVASQAALLIFALGVLVVGLRRGVQGKRAATSP
ncbi:hypothetical protein [Actinomycetospora straminea]|uniref:DUF4386 family protein n=1 Tax=Actinomycetospora straminea TaxID=663607 RepID=A0ABP9F7R4_9PSEU|nr:hypothetical protein [Actinomycetospora straminea]MDD7934770.1 hypothetical protein [Actinomycetospora straminea]